MNIFLSSDLHLGHSNILNFKRDDGVTPLRSFSDIHHMNEHIIYKHNLVVKPADKWYCLGDIAMQNKYLSLLERMNGEKILIKGNHDLEKLSTYAKYFKDVRAVHQLDGMILSHIPIHPESLSRWKVNVHGHLHHRHVLLPSGWVDQRYINVSMEQLDDYTPISLEDLKKGIK